MRSSTLAAPLLLALQEELLVREAWPLIRTELPGADEAFWQHARDAHLDGFPRRRARRGAGHRRVDRHPGAGQHARARPRRRGAHGARRPRPRARARGGAGAPLVPDAVADGRGRAAGRDGHDRVRRLRAPRAVPRPRRRDRGVDRAAPLPGPADRAPEGRARAAHRGRGHRPHAVRRGAHLGQLRRQAQHALRRGLHGPATRRAPRAASASRSPRARAASRSRGSSSSSARAASSTRAPSAARST